MSASASFDLAKLPAALRPETQIVETPAIKLPDASDFSEGQMSGPFGPKFSHYAEQAREKASITATLGFALGVAILAGAIMVIA